MVQTRFQSTSRGAAAGTPQPLRLDPAPRHSIRTSTEQRFVIRDVLVICMLLGMLIIGISRLQGYKCLVGQVCRVKINSQVGPATGSEEASARADPSRRQIVFPVPGIQYYHPHYHVPRQPTRKWYPTPCYIQD